VEGMGTAAFKSCSRLSYVSLSEKIVSLPDFLFADCISLKELLLPENLRYIGDGVFSNCQALICINIPDKVSSIGKYAFEGCRSLENISLSRSLSKIACSSFKDCDSLVRLALPDSITVIENNAFENCSSLKEISFSNRLKKIADNAFLNCSSLESLQLPYGLTAICSQAFAGCGNLKDIKLPPDITDIASDILDGSAISAVFDNGLLILDGYLLDGSAASGCLFIPDSVRHIAAGAFKNNTKLTGVIIPDSVCSIGSSAFYGCSRLEMVELPETITTLADGIFYGCAKLAYINLPKKLTMIKSNSFYNCLSLKSVSLPKGLTRIEDYAFYGCSNLESISFPASLTHIGSYAFSKCSSLGELNLPGNIKWVGKNAFSYCTSLNTLHAAAEIISDNAFAECTMLSKVRLTDKVLNLGAYAFKNCSSLKSAVLSSNLTVIEYGTFAGCSSLESIYIPNSTEYILGAAFENCISLKSIYLPRNIFIDEKAFSGCELDIKSGFNFLTDDISEPVRFSDDNSCHYPGNFSTTDGEAYYLTGVSSYNEKADLIRLTQSGKIIKIGSSSGYSDFIKYKDYVYYLDSKRNLCRLSIADGKQSRLIKKVDILVAIYRDYIYYIADKSLCRSTIDGNEHTRLAVLSMDTISAYYRSNAVQFVDNYIYFVTSRHQNWLCSIEKINLDGTGHKVLAKGLALKDLNYDIYAAGGRIYYQTDDNLLYSIDQNGVQYMHGQGQIHGVIKDELYYSDENGLWKLSDKLLPILVLDGKFMPMNARISDITEDGSTLILYCAGDDDSERGYIYLVNTDGNTVTVLTEGDTIWPPALYLDYIYYKKDYNYENGPVYYLRTRYK